MELKHHAEHGQSNDRDGGNLEPVYPEQSGDITQCANPTRTRAIADGRVKPSQAANAPRYPARERPMARPTWLLAGPGRNWHGNEVCIRGLIEPLAPDDKSSRT